MEPLTPSSIRWPTGLNHVRATQMTQKNRSLKDDDAIEAQHKDLCKCGTEGGYSIYAVGWQLSRINAVHVPHWLDLNITTITIKIKTTTTTQTTQTTKTIKTTKIHWLNKIQNDFPLNPKSLGWLGGGPLFGKSPKNGIFVFCFPYQQLVTQLNSPILLVLNFPA